MGKTTRPVRYNLNQIPYEYTVEAKNRVKRLDLVNSGQSSIIPHRRQHKKPSQWGKKRKKAKWLSEKALQRAEGRREAKSKGERERDTQLNAEFRRTARTDKKAFNEQPKECRTTTERVRLEISSRNL